MYQDAIAWNCTTTQQDIYDSNDWTKQIAGAMRNGIVDSLGSFGYGYTVQAE